MATHTFIYDDACPMCKGYTGVFTHLQWSQRRAFSTLGSDELPTLDRDRGRHEIPLVNAGTGEVRYGLDAMTTVLGEALPLLAPLLRQRYFIAVFKPLYWLITYNRRVIAGTKPPIAGYDCAPDLHRRWRWTYIFLAGWATYLLGVPNTFLLAGFGLYLVAGLLLEESYLDFLGGFVTVLLGCALLLAVFPAGWGLGFAYLFALREGWRRK